MRVPGDDGEQRELRVASASSIDGKAIYATDQGSGDQSGRDFENAIAVGGDRLQAAWDRLGPGDTLYLGSGTYRDMALQIQAGGSGPNAMITLQGIDTGDGLPLITGNFDKANPGKTGQAVVRAAADTGYWAVRDLQMRDVKHGVVLDGRNLGVRIHNVDVTRCREGVTIHGGLTTAEPFGGTHDVVVSDCEFGPYTKRGIRIRDGVSGVRIVNCHADAGGKDWATERFHVGFAVQGSKMPGVFDHDIAYIGCTSRNNYDDAGDEYWNADGFTAERQTYNITYTRCEAHDNTDGGWDVKAINPVLIDCIATGNKRNVRVWSKPGPALLVNCELSGSVKLGGSGTSAGIHLTNGGQALAIGCKILQNGINLDIDAKPDNPNTAGSLLTVQGGEVSSPTSEQATLDPSARLILQGITMNPPITPSDAITVRYSAR
jgi:hypothetical protein